jgi:hypothetical protein
MQFRDISSLTTIPVSQRDEVWEREFLRSLPQAQLTIVNETPIVGPDGWPYLLVATGGDEPFLKVANWLVSQGVGMVVNPDKPIPDYVISYGMIWNLRERGEFFTQIDAPQAGPVELRHGQQVFAGPPSSAYLPQDVRAILREFFRQQKIDAPKVLMVSENQKRWDLAISIESLGSPPDSEHAGVAEAVSWFLPGHYSIILMRESVLPGFVPL